MKQIAIISRVDDRSRNEYIRRRLVWNVTDDQLTRLAALINEIEENEGNTIYPHAELFGSDGEVTFPDRQLEGMEEDYGGDGAAEDEACYRYNVSLMDYITDYRGKMHDRFNIANDLVVYDEDGNMYDRFPGFTDC